MQHPGSNVRTAKERGVGSTSVKSGGTVVHAGPKGPKRVMNGAK